MHGFKIVIIEDLFLETYPITLIRAPTLTELVLKDSLIDEAGVLQLLLQYPLLQHLKLHWAHRSVIRQSDTFSTPYPRLGDHLGKRGQRLRTLELDLREVMCNEWHGTADEHSSLGTLAGLSQLETLGKPLEILLGQPENLSIPLDVALDQSLNRSLRRLDLLTWPRDISLSDGLRRVMNLTRFSHLDLIAVDISPLFAPNDASVRFQAEEAPPEWSLSRGEETLTFQRVKVAV